jgi:hypothetical protein
MDRIATVIGGMVAALAIAILFSLVVAWPFMIAMGNLHAFMPTVPAAGFFDVWSVTIWFSAGVAVMRANSGN